MSYTFAFGLMFGALAVAIVIWYFHDRKKANDIIKRSVDNTVDAIKKDGNE